MLGAVREVAAGFGLRLDQWQLSGLSHYLELLLEANQRFNLTSLQDSGAMQHRHLLESLALGAFLDRRGLLGERTRILDLGSGGGLPGLPIRLTWPAVRLSLLDATAKKARFLDLACASLGLDDVTVLCGRAETLARDPELREQFDLVIARAVAALPALIELALPFLIEGGSLAAVKGSRAEEEISAAAVALSLCGGRLGAHEPLPASQRLSVVLIDKVAPTPARYPRAPGRPATAPLGAGRRRF